MALLFLCWQAIFVRQKPTETNEMIDNGTLTERQRRVIPYLLASSSMEEACRLAKINKTTVYEWLKNKAFRNELGSQRNAVIEHALDTLKTAMAKATETLIKHLDSEQENISIRAAQSVIEFAQHALEFENLEKRISSLEERLIQQGGNR